jgi:hypothetical protein
MTFGKSSWNKFRMQYHISIGSMIKFEEKIVDEEIGEMIKK